MGNLPFKEWCERTSEVVEPLYPNRPVFAVDWDGVCVYEKNTHTGRPFWPGMGPWMPGAVEGLRQLSDNGLTTIFSLRCSPVGVDAVTPRTTQEWIDSIAQIRAMLDEQGLTQIGIWTGAGKPPAAVYIDDRGYRHQGWTTTLMAVLEDGFLHPDEF